MLDDLCNITYITALEVLVVFREHIFGKYFIFNLSI